MCFCLEAGGPHWPRGPPTTAPRRLPEVTVDNKAVLAPGSLALARPVGPPCTRSAHLPVGLSSWTTSRATRGAKRHAQTCGASQPGVCERGPRAGRWARRGRAPGTSAGAGRPGRRRACLWVLVADPEGDRGHTPLVWGLACVSPLAMCVRLRVYDSFQSSFSPHKIFILVVQGPVIAISHPELFIPRTD